MHIFQQPFQIAVCKTGLDFSVESFSNSEYSLFDPNLAIITSVRDGHGNGLITIDNRQINFLLGPVMVFVMMLSMLLNEVGRCSGVDDISRYCRNLLDSK